MTDQEQPEQWAVELLEVVSEVAAICTAVDCSHCAKMALTIQRAFTERTADLAAEAVKQVRLKFVNKPCRHTTTSESETARPDLHDWQTDQSEWFDATILEIVGEYAAWRDKRDADLVADNAKLREANLRLRNGYADAVAGFNYILVYHSRLSGVGFDRVLDHFAEWVTMPEREGLHAGSHTLAQQDKPDAK